MVRLFSAVAGSLGAGCRNLNPFVSYALDPYVNIRSKFAKNAARETLPLGRGAERQFFGTQALCSSPLAEEETCFSSPALVGPIGNIESLGSVGGCS